MKLEEQKKHGIILLVTGIVLGIIFAVTDIGKVQDSLLCGIASCLAVVGAVRLIRAMRIQADPQRAEDYEAALHDERTAYIANKARSLTFVIVIYVQLAAGLFCGLVLDQPLLCKVFCCLTCFQSLLYTVIYRVYSRKY